ncbi:prepilin-type N-terminal cleavage/methylation domain-containing protein [Candidatus Gottesmanbacteria bacterium]|nr:prepilin-type N-terminal cleavage/methylation domain-containing protein [Candidatus Gottesmanbacteria bacterium]
MKTQNSIRQLADKTQKFGFTIIELLISIAIIAILLGASFAGYARLNQRQTLISAGQNLKNILRDAQNRSGNADLDCGIGNKCDCTSGADAGYKGWYADFVLQKIYSKCGTIIPYQFGDKAFGLSSDVSLTVIPAGSPLLFKNNPPGVSSKTTICVTHNNLPATFYVIHINENGAISDEGGLVGACPP